MATTKWETLGRPSASTTIDIALNLHQENVLIYALYEVSDQGTYTSQLLRWRLHSLPLHPETALELFTSLLVHHGVRSSSISTTRGSAQLTVSNALVSQANEMLGA
ncbi:hypothetical protein EDB86DRAFT_3077567 [Lactarius hatsudake]|nr:hypothetical protein EDB86DRAFT_3077567 [Lactarius hatsudake]